MRITISCFAALLLGVVASSYFMPEEGTGTVEEAQRSALVAPQFARHDAETQQS
jgi:hypothetical protein